MVADRDLWKVEAAIVGMPLVPFITPDLDKMYEWARVTDNDTVTAFLYYRQQSDGVWRLIDVG
jgi:hypothetical protein